MVATLLADYHYNWGSATGELGSDNHFFFYYYHPSVCAFLTKSNCRIQFLLALFDYNQNVQRSLNVNVTHKVWQQSTSFTNSQYCNAAPFNKLTAAKELVKLDRTHDYKISVLGIGGLPIGTAMHRSRPLM